MLEGFNLELPPGRAHLLAGPSGSGKSTILRLASGLIPEVQGGRIAGRITLDGAPVDELPARSIPERIGYVPQDPEQAFVARTVERELAGVLENVGTPRTERERRIEEALHAFGAGHLAHRETATLSGGEAARVALAAALVAEPALLLLDEPHAQLDARARRELAGALRGLKAGGRSILLAAHPPHPFEPLVDARTRLGSVQASPPRTLPQPADGDPQLILEDVRHAYTDEASVGPVNLGLEPGEVVALTGPNGSGKTTALHAACGLIEPTEGRVRLLGENPRELSPGQRARRVAVAFQHPAWHITQDTLVREVAFTARRTNQDANVDATLAALGLDHLADVHPWDLSGGQRQRMAVATALAHDPPVVLLDEPTRGLGPSDRQRLAGLLAERTRRGHATLVASHHPWLHDLAHRTVHLGDEAQNPDAHAIEEVVYA